MKPLYNKVALVAGATRGAGRGIACMLGEAGATVYCTGRSVRGKPASGSRRPETIEETAEMASAYGGAGIPVPVDHTVEAQVEALFERVKREQGRLDLLVNDVWGGEELTEWGKPFWELSIEKGLAMLYRALHPHIITSRHGAPLLVERRRGLIVEITDGDFFGYRGNLFYRFGKNLGHPPGLCHGQGVGQARRRRPGGYPRLPALGGNARPLWGDGSELAGRGAERYPFHRFGDTLFRGPGGGGAGGRSAGAQEIRAGFQLLGFVG